APLTGWPPGGWSGWAGRAEPGSESATPLGYEAGADLGISLLGLHARFGQTVQTWPGSPLGRAVDLSLPGRRSLAPSRFADWPGLGGEGRAWPSADKSIPRTVGPLVLDRLRPLSYACRTRG